jgi:hypothetical protein
MKVVGLKVVFETAVAGAWCKQKVHAIPKKMKRRAKQREAGQNASEVVQVLSRVHAQSSKRLDVCVAMVQ